MNKSLPTHKGLTWLTLFAESVDAKNETRARGWYEEVTECYLI